MATWFLTIIYLAFISLGLPDSLLGSAWPVMRPELGASLGSAGLITMIIAGGTIVSSLFSGKMTELLGTGKITLISCLMTAGALYGFSAAPSLFWLIVLAIPLGLGAGAVDAALNHYVATHYKAHHMSWLHCFWGVGATMGPIIMSYYIAEHNSWRSGYGAVSLIQFGLVIILLVTLPLWGKIAAIHKQSGASGSHEPANSEEEAPAAGNGGRVNVLQIKGVKNTLIAFLFYCGLELTVGLWGASYLVGVRGLNAQTAAAWVSLYYAGITVGRLITGFITLKVSNLVLIRTGQLTAMAGGLLILLPLPDYFALAGLILIGIGLAPIYPGLLHETPARFGAGNSSRLMGYQMAVAYTGSTLLPPLFGLIATRTSVAIFPVAVILFLVFMFLSAESVNRVIRKKQAAG
ncbi:MFS transporter [Paenibacillus sp. MMS20-IR301]|uniref:MFS transporter n=1 Tax=Paenibacillus sp. MMS20-IR301 TaxID=2895946 RepID=UPI0028E197D5|nr:MFS transporter [Paenibacillus sp. MMS20-IR301]WNS45266.1 MFS transporter [Paenibacillus sp. MMS20-IR301]